MQPTLKPEPRLQQRLKKFIRQPDRLADRQLTEKGLEVIAAIERYRFAPSSLLVRLVPGGQRNNYRHLQTLFHKGLINRFALPTLYGSPGEFIYYLDNLSTLNLLIEQGLVPASAPDRRRREETIRLNREKAYSQLHKDPDMQGKLMFIQHELMVSRFHALLEMACRSPKLAGKVQLEQWKQGPELWTRVEVPKLKQEAGLWHELDKTEYLPHRPDAFFTLKFPGKPEGEQLAHFLYEADRGTENTTRFKLKLRAHYHFIVKQNLQRTMGCYNVHAFRAVLVESTNMHWAQNLREAARHVVVSPKASPLFWFTTSEVFTKSTAAAAGQRRPLPLYLTEPECVFKRIWASPVEDTFLNLAD